jgi:hypothetical protein
MGIELGEAKMPKTLDLLNYKFSDQLTTYEHILPQICSFAEKELEKKLSLACDLVQ